MRILTDNGPIFRSEAFKTFLAENNVRHSRIRPTHAWTNGRIERLFRTFKETVFRCAWVFTSLRQIDRSTSRLRHVVPGYETALVAVPA